MQSLQLLLRKQMKQLHIYFSEELLKILGNFYARPEIRKFAAENGLDSKSYITGLLYLV